MAEIRINPAEIPKPNAWCFAKATADAIKRIRREDPEAWARIEARAEEIRRNRERAAI